MFPTNLFWCRDFQDPDRKLPDDKNVVIEGAGKKGTWMVWILLLCNYGG
jgi:hypothetical protein